MAYTNIWNDNLPNGSEAANTIASIIAGLKTDIDQRFSDIFAIPDFTADPLRPYGLKLTDAADSVIFLGDNAGTPRSLIFKNKAGSASYVTINSTGIAGALIGNASTATLATHATALATARLIFGQSFDGSGDVSGALTASTGNFNGLITATGGARFTTNVAVDAAGGVIYSTVDGLRMWGKNGTTYAWSILNDAGNYVMRVPINTRSIEVVTGASRTILLAQWPDTTTYNAISLNGVLAGSSMTGLLGGAAGDNVLYLLTPTTSGGIKFRVGGTDAMIVDSTLHVILGTDPGTASLVRIGGNVATSGAVIFTANVTTGILGSIMKHVNYGVMLYGSGTLSDVTLFNGGGNPVIEILAGTLNTNFAGGIIIAGDATFNGNVNFGATSTVTNLASGRGTISALNNTATTLFTLPGAGVYVINGSISGTSPNSALISVDTSGTVASITVSGAGTPVFTLSGLNVQGRQTSGSTANILYSYFRVN